MPYGCIVQTTLWTLYRSIRALLIRDHDSKPRNCTNLFLKNLCCSITLCSWLQAVWNTVALGATQNKLPFLNRIAVCDVRNHLHLLWQCTDTSLQPHRICSAMCRYIFGQLHCLHTDQLCLTSENAWCSAKQRDCLLTHSFWYYFWQGE